MIALALTSLTVIGTSKLNHLYMTDPELGIPYGCIGLEYPSSLDANDEFIGRICNVFFELIDLYLMEEHLPGSIPNLFEVCP